MANAADATVTKPVRPDRQKNDPLPGLPDVAGLTEEKASTTYSHYRTGLSNHRTHLSEHRTDLSEFRTDLSSSRTAMSQERTGLSLQRTRMSMERTLMSFIRTSLSLISFGFTIHAAFTKMVDAGMLQQSRAPTNFGLALIFIGVFIMLGGIWRHVQFAQYLRHLTATSTAEGTASAHQPFPISVTLVSAVALMLVGIVAIINIMA